MKRDDDSLDLLIEKLRWLRLAGMAQLVASLLEQAKNENLTDLEILHRLFDEERASRMKSAVDRRIKDHQATWRSRHAAWSHRSRTQHTVP
jgi:hypothetical protein